MEGFRCTLSDKKEKENLRVSTVVTITTRGDKGIRSRAAGGKIKASGPEKGKTTTQPIYP